MVSSLGGGLSSIAYEGFVGGLVAISITPHVEGLLRTAETRDFPGVRWDSKKSPNKICFTKQQKKSPDNLIFDVGVSVEQA